jgi:hypothetical protein
MNYLKRPAKKKYPKRKETLAGLTLGCPWHDLDWAFCVFISFR